MQAPPPLVRECRYLSQAPDLRGVKPSTAQGAPTGGHVRGYAALFNTRSEDLGWAGHSFYEVIEPWAFDGLDYEGVVALFNHDQNLPLARCGAGLDLGVDTRGLWYEFELPDTSAGRDLRELLTRGIVSQSSFAFTVAEDGQDWQEEEVLGGTVVTRTIKQISALYDVSLVTSPAYADTSVALRGLYAHRAQYGQQKLPLVDAARARALSAEVYALTGLPLSKAS